MAKLNLLLLAVLVACALGLVTSQNQTRQVFSRLQQAQRHERRLNVEYGKLQLEASTWGQHARVQKIATQVLDMHVPDPDKVRIIVPQTEKAN